MVREMFFINSNLDRFPEPKFDWESLKGKGKGGGGSKEDKDEEQDKKKKKLQEGWHYFLI